MLVANLDPIQLSSSHPPILSIIVMTLGNSAIVWMAFSRSKLSFTKECRNCLKTKTLVHSTLSLYSSLDQSRPVFSSNNFSFLPCFRDQRRDSVRLSSNHWSWEQMPKHLRSHTSVSDREQYFSFAVSEREHRCAIRMVSICTSLRDCDVIRCRSSHASSSNL